MFIVFISYVIKHGKPFYVANILFEILVDLNRMKEGRLNKQSEGASEILSWVNRSRKLEERKNAEKEKALQLSKIFEEQVSVYIEASACITRNYCFLANV